MIRLSFRFLYGPKGKRIFTLDTSRVKEFLDFSDECVARLATVFCLPDNYLRRLLPKERIDYLALASEYQRLLESGEYKDRADVARRFGVSRAWVTKVMKRGINPSWIEQ